MLVERAEVLKFGGTSVGDADAFRQSCSVVERHLKKGKGLVVVVSAMAGVTNQLHDAYNLAVGGNIDQSHGLINDIAEQHIGVLRQLAGTESTLSAEERIGYVTTEVRGVLQALSIFQDNQPSYKDKVVSAGERMSPHLMGAVLQSMGRPAVVLDAAQLMKTDNRFGDANPDIGLTMEKVKEYVLPAMAEGKVVIIGGYFGTDRFGKLTTFGRGGSDRSATILARILDKLGLEVPGVFLYKADVGGVMSADPKIVPEAHIVPYLTREETAILAGLGGNVLHAKAVQELTGTQVPIYCRSTTRPDEPGTVIDQRILPENPPVKVVTAQWPLLLATIEGMGMDQPNIAGRIFQMLGKEGIDVRAIFQPISEHQVRIVVSPKVNSALLKDKFLALLQPLIETQDISIVEVDSGLSAVGIIGPGVGKRDAMDKITRAIYHNGDGNSGERVLNISTGHNLCSVLLERDEDGNSAVNMTRSLHNELFSGQDKEYIR